MKQLILLRHGEAEPHRDADHSRRLTPKGRGEATSVGIKLRGEIILPTLVLSSDAARAKETAELASAELGSFSIQFHPEFYSGNVYDIQRALEENFDRFETIIVVGHNPTWSDATDHFASHSIGLGTGHAAVLKMDEKKSEEWRVHLQDFKFDKVSKP